MPIDGGRQDGDGRAVAAPAADEFIQRINAACRQFGTTYSRFIEGLTAAKIEVDRKALADLAVTDEATFKAILDKAVAALN